MKKYLALLLAVAMLLALPACAPPDTSATEAAGTTEPVATEAAATVPATENATEPVASTETITIRAGVPSGPPALPLLRMIDSQALGENVDIELNLWNEPESLIAMVQDGNHDVFAFPLTVVSKLYNKGLPVRLMNVNTWGVTYFVTSDPDLKEWSDLKGKTVYIPLQSSPPDALTQFFLSEAGLTVGTDLEVVYSSMQEIATMLASGDAEYATLIEPQVSRAMMANENLRVAFSFEEEWQQLNDTKDRIPNAGFGATQSFIDENPELAAKFQKAYEEAVIWANEHPEEMGALAEKHLGLKTQVIAKALPNMGLHFKSATDAKTELDLFYRLLHDFNPEMIGGKIPDDGMLYDEK